MIAFPNAKINIGLYVTAKRTDGYHNLETVFCPVAFNDTLEVITSPDGELRFTQSGIAIPGNPSDNICWKAYRLIKEDFPDIPPVHIHLHKTIPTGAGLGGGSSNGTHTLDMLNRLFQLSLNTNQLVDKAKILGSDCAFFVYNQPMYATGRGEVLTPSSLNISQYSILVVHPSIHIATSVAFGSITPQPAPKNWHQLLLQPPEEWRQHIKNDFESNVFAEYPEVRQIKEKLYQNNAMYAAMSGSGSAVFGIYKKGAVPVIDWPAHYSVKIIP